MNEPILSTGQGTSRKDYFAEDFGVPAEEPVDTIQADFERYHADHPEVFEFFREFAWEAKVAGYTRYSADYLLHRIRWHETIERRNRKFKINDDYSSRYARLLMEMNPRNFGEFFETRKLNHA